MKKIVKVAEKNMLLEKCFANEDDLSAVSQWDLMSLVAFIAGEDFDLHAKFRCDIAALTLAKAGSIGVIRIDSFQAVALIEVLHPIKFAIFLADKDLIEINISDTFVFFVLLH